MIPRRPHHGFARAVLPMALTLVVLLTLGCTSGANIATNSPGKPDSSTTADASAADAPTAADGFTTDGGSEATIDLPDPVQGSEGDTTLFGTDADKNGVRDDVDQYIAALETDPEKRTALVAFARESTAMMILGGKAGTANAAAAAQAQRVGRTLDCLHDLYVADLSNKQTLVENLRDALYDNAMRLRAYNHASTLVSGTLLRARHGCDPSISGVSR